MPINDDAIKRFRASLHEVTGTLSVLIWRAEEVAEGLKQENSPLSTQAEEVESRLKTCVSALNLLQIKMHAAWLGQKTLNDALSEYTKMFSDDVVVSMAIDDTANQFPKIAETIFFMATEAIANAVIHGNAKHIELTIANSENQIILRVADDGLGFDPTKVTRIRGISYIKEAAALQGGECSIDSEPGGGATLTATIPMQLQGES